MALGFGFLFGPKEREDLAISVGWLLHFLDSGRHHVVLQLAWLDDGFTGRRIRLSYVRVRKATMVMGGRAPDDMMRGARYVYLWFMLTTAASLLGRTQAADRRQL